VALRHQAEQWRHRRRLEALPPHLRETPPLPEGQQNDPVRAYASLRQRILTTTPNLEASRLDARIALSMRLNGFTQEAILETIFQCAPREQTKQADRDWRRYAERAAAYAFGVAGDMTLLKSVVPQEQQERKNAAQQGEVVRQAPRIRMR
jgi:hypothetical protein